jgi:alkanesulfonate monooxygenase SsuD/methylene tetrahydromethanopterin reductase-like flavin-dependent oxidoreductase (luciferase family)
MRYGFVIPSGTLFDVVSLAQDAEIAGWDGVFIPDCIYIDAEPDPMSPGYDPWIALAAVAVQTSRIRIGTMITPLSRRRPWKVARETVTLDHLSHGRLTLPIGLGALDDAGFGRVGEVTDRKTRAELLDESLEILGRAWSGQTFSYTGTHYSVRDLTFLPPPAQSPRVPVWVVAAWPRPKSVRRALRWDGILPQKMDKDGSQKPMTPDDLRDLRDYIAENRAATTPFDIIVEGTTSGADPDAARAQVQPYADAGATWWMEALWSKPNDPATVRERIRQGPPRLASQPPALSAESPTQW